MKLGNNIRKYRFEHGEMTQQELANEVGVTRLTIHSIETGKFMPTTLLALKLGEFFGRTVEELFYIIKEEDSEG